MTYFCLAQLLTQIGVVLGYVNGTSGLTVALRLLGVGGLVLTGLWPTGCPLNQTLQDNAAGTIVVRTR
jgi:hypothetical protein